MRKKREKTERNTFLSRISLLLKLDSILYY